MRRFLARVAEDGFFEWATILGEYYGTPMPEPESGRDIVLEIDVQGARQVLERCPDAYCVLVRAPSPAGAEAAAPVQGRPGGAHTNAASPSAGSRTPRGSKLARRVLVNDDLTGPCSELAEIVEEARREESPSAR